MRSRVLGVIVVVLCFAHGAAAAALVERVLAVVDNRPIFLSDVVAVEKMDQSARSTALERVIDETLLFQQAFRLPQAATTPEEEKALRESAVPGGERSAHRRAVVQKYIAFRFRPQVRIDDEQVRKAYETEWEGRDGAPPLASVAASIRERLTFEEVAARVAAWLRDLRTAARIRYNKP